MRVKGFLESLWKGCITERFFLHPEPPPTLKSVLDTNYEN